MNTYPKLIARCGKHLAVFTIITMGATHCASTEDGRLAQAQGTGLGALGGGLLGAGIGALAGDSDSVRKGALIGAGIGAAGGFAYGTHVANKKAQYKSTEEWLDACISEAETKRREAVAYNKRLNNQLARLRKEVRLAREAEDRRKLASLERQIAVERAAAQKQAAAFNKEIEMLRGAIKQANGESSSRVDSLRTSTNGIQNQVSTMNNTVERYAALESQAGN